MGHFGKFGRVLNVTLLRQTVRPPSPCAPPPTLGAVPQVKLYPEARYAFVDFSSRLEAVAALDAPEPVMGRPEIRIGWATRQPAAGRGGHASYGKGGGAGARGGGEAAEEEGAAPPPKGPHARAPPPGAKVAQQRQAQAKKKARPT